MFRLKKLNAAMMAVAASTTAFAATEIEEVIVTATKRASSAQEIPVTVNVLDETTMDDVAIGNFDDYVRHLPNVSSASVGPGRATVYIRGMAVQPITVLLSGAQGTTPNVALYLDEQPVTAPGRNLDVYATDIQRIEVLPGPQGTLFGASSQAGTIRLITNKPQVDAFATGADVTMSNTKDGDMSTAIEAFINIPVNDRMAVRGAFYSVSEGGYIDNVLGSFTTDPAINPLSTASASAVRYEAANNGALVESDFNDSYYKGARISGSYALTPDERWMLEDVDVLVQHTTQELGSDGVFDFDPEVGDLDVNRYFPDRLSDEFGLTSWTVSGRAGALDLMYTGGYLDRKVEQMVDYTGYNNSGAWISYYTCTYSNPAYVVNYGVDSRFITPGGRECLSPVKGAILHQSQERTTHEFRFTTPEENRIRLTAGVFIDEFEIETQDDYLYEASTDLGFVPNAPIAAAAQVNASTRAPGITFFNDIRRTEEQVAFFGEVSYDLSDKVTALIGMRRYDLEIDFEGSSNFGDGIFQGSPGVGVTNQDRGRDYDVSGGHSKDPREFDDIITKFTLSYTPKDNVLLFATISEGYRPGGWNRGGGIPSVNPAFPTVTANYNTDDVDNIEFGWKATLADGSVQLNGNVYFIEWTNMQVTRFDPQNVSILTFVENAADADIKGVEADLIWNVDENWTINAAISINDTELTDVYGQAVELAAIGSQLPLMPDLQTTIRARRDWVTNEGYEAFVQLGLQTGSDSYSSLVAVNRRDQDAYATVDLSMGVSRDEWSAGLFIENLTDERVDQYINNQDDIMRVTTNRPLTISLRVSYDI
ncbi:MAG: TonB-dependent receptor [Gammaproteobacteria bacterium]|nr:TonB-dependent receptor [Gammaproteobacteria bacterium]